MNPPSSWKYTEKPLDLCDLQSPDSYHPYFDTGPFDTSYPEEDNTEGERMWFIFRGNELLVPAGETSLSFRTSPDIPGFVTCSCIYIGNLDGVPCYAVSLDNKCVTPPGYRFTDIRGLHGLVSDVVLGIAGRASQVLLFDRTTTFCGCCGSRTRLKKTELAKECPGCGNTIYPRLSPAVIVLVHRGEEVLLARSPRFPIRTYSVIAGFVEPGETIEHALHREVMEETGISVCNPVYFGSQPWPFPDSLMIGFTAAYAGGEIRPDNEEIEDAGWFRYDALPPLPGPLSISRALIEWFVRSRSENARNTHE